MERLLAILAVVWVVFMSGCKKDEYVAKVGVCPIVVSTSPANEAVGVPLNQAISITFNEKMNPATFTPESFVLQGTTVIAGTKAAVVVTGAFTFEDKTVIFTPSSPLTANTTFTGTVKTAVKDLSGNALQVSYVWSFTTGTPPTVTTTNPANNAISVALNTVITATFSAPMDPLTITAMSVTVKQGTTAIAGAVSYTGTTVSFAPAVPFTANTVYTATITTLANNGTGIGLASDYVWTFSTGTSPTVISTDPANIATGISLTKAVSATFSVPMDPLTFSKTTFNLKLGSSAIAGAVTFSGSVAVFTPTIGFSPNTVYTATITTGVKNIAGLPLVNDYVWTFTTGIAPTVLSTEPSNNATAVVLGKTVTAGFSVAMDPLTLTGTTFTLKQGGTSVVGTVSYTGTTASFNPTSDLLPNTVYTATITKGSKNAVGIPLENDFVWTFTTEALPSPTVTLTDPTDNATGVALNKIIDATFNVSMNSSTITSSTFTIKNGANAVSGIVSLVGKKASFSPSSNLLPGTTYTATITTGAQNLAGVSLTNNFVWSFTTQSNLVVVPTVNLNSAAQFGILAGVGISNDAGFSVINNQDVGIYPGVRSSVTGFPPATIVGGNIYASDDITPAGVAAMLNQAKLDLVAAYLFAEGATTPAPASVSGDQGGLTLAPGIYKSTSTLLIQSGDLTLDGQGDPNATWIFQVASGFTTIGGAGGSIILTGGAQAKNIFWQTGSSAVIGDYTTFNGNILALQSITLNSHAVAVGRMLAQNGSVVMTHTNTINKP